MMKAVRRHLKLLLAVYLLLSMAVCVRFGLLKGFLETRERVPRLDSCITETIVYPDETACYRLDWPYAGEIQLVLRSSSENVPVEVTLDGAAQHLTIGVEPVVYKLPVHGMVYEMTIRTESAAEPVVVDNILVISDYSIPRFLSMLAAAWGMGLAVFFVLKSRLDLSTLALTLGLSLCFALGKTVSVPHGWDEVIHMTLTWYTAGLREDSIAWYIYSFSLWYIGYFPAALGVLIGSLLQMPEMLIYRMGNISSAIIYALLCMLAVRHAPKYKLTVMAIAAMPTCVFQAGCYTYDGVVIAGSLLGCSLLLETIESGKKLTASRAVLLFLPLCVMMLPKPVYCLLLLLLFFLPVRMFRNRKQQKMFRAYTMILVMWSMVALLMPGQYSNVTGGDSRIVGADSAGQLAAFLENPLNALKAFAKYALTGIPVAFAEAPLYQLGSYTNGLGGWMGMLISAVVLLVCPVYCRGESAPTRLTAGNRVRMAVIAVLPMLALMVTQYFVSTVPGSTEVYGMQQRYALPLWLLIAGAMMMPEKLRRRFEKYSELAAVAVIAVLTIMTYYAAQTAILSMWLLG